MTSGSIDSAVVKFSPGFKPTRSAAGLQQTTERTLPSSEVTTVGCSLRSHCKASRGNWGRVIQSHSMTKPSLSDGSSNGDRHACACAPTLHHIDIQLPVPGSLQAQTYGCG